jgi:hypothetical protein
MDGFAMDEGFADVWAYLTTGQNRIGTWFMAPLDLYAVNHRLKDYYDNRIVYSRDLTRTPHYPEQLQAEGHVDSSFISTVFYQLAQRSPYANDRSALRRLTAHTLESLPKVASFEDVFKFVREELGATAFPIAEFETLLDERGLRRKDQAAQLSLASTQAYIIDNHEIGFSPNTTNCNGALDRGEGAMIVVNLQNTGASLGRVQYRVTTTAPSSELQLYEDFNTGNYLRFNADADFRSSLPVTRGSDSAKMALTAAGFYVFASPTAHGLYHFDLQVQAMDTIDDTPTTKMISLNIPVGTGGGSTSNCAGNLESTVWP